MMITVIKTFFCGMPALPDVSGLAALKTAGHDISPPPPHGRINSGYTTPIHSSNTTEFSKYGLNIQPAAFLKITLFSAKYLFGKKPVYRINSYRLNSPDRYINACNKLFLKFWGYTAGQRVVCLEN
jgi:hypothetical protein